MLAAKPELTGKGVGRLLISACEVRAKIEGCSTIKLELLEPSEWQHPIKSVLHKWYQDRLGYVKGEQKVFAEFYPQLSPFLSGPTKFTEYVKHL